MVWGYLQWLAVLMHHNASLDSTSLVTSPAAPGAEDTPGALGPAPGPAGPQGPDSPSSPLERTPGRARSSLAKTWPGAQQQVLEAAPLG